MADNDTPDRPQKWWQVRLFPSSTVPYLSLLVAVGALVASFWFGNANNTIALGTQKATSLLNEQWYCAQYTAWIVDRIEEGMTDEAIADISPVLSLQLVTVANPADPPSRLPTSDPRSDSSFQEFMEPGSTEKRYGLCGVTSLDALIGWVQTIRASMYQTAAPTTR